MTPLSYREAPDAIFLYLHVKYEQIQQIRSQLQSTIHVRQSKKFKKSWNKTNIWWRLHRFSLIAGDQFSSRRFGPPMSCLAGEFSIRQNFGFVFLQ